MRAGSRSPGAGPANRVIAAPPGSDQARSAVRYLAELQRRGTTASLIVRGKVLSRYLNSLLPFGARAVIPYQPYLRELWKSAIRAPLAQVDEYSLDLWEFRRQLVRSGAARPPRAEHAVVLHGQELPVEFYELLRLLGVAATVFADSSAVVGDDGSTLDELTRTLGVAAPTVLPDEARTTTPIYDFLERLHPVAAGFSSRRPDQPGDRPLLAHHETLEGEAQFVEDYARTHGSTRIGLVVPLADLAVAFRKALAPGLGDQLQWHLAEAAVPRGQRVDFRISGVKLLTWSSALGLEFDTVILAGLHYAGNGRPTARVAATLQLLAASAQEQLILSYSGPGEPTALDFLPRQLLEVRETLPSLAEIPQPTGPEPVHRATVLTAMTPAPRPDPPVQRPAAEIARPLLAYDRDQKSRRRVLTAQEEVGLAQLMRGSGGDLTAALPKGFRASLRPGDERAAAFDALVAHNEGLVWSIVRTYTGSGLDDEDLYQHGILGLMRAIEKFDASQGTKFSTYGTWWIRQGMTRGIANEGAMIRIPVHLHEQIRKVAIARSRLLSQYGYTSLTAISRSVGMTPDKVAECLRLGAGVVSLDAPLRDDPDFSIADLISVDPDEVTDPGEIIDRRAGIEVIRKALDRMNDRNAIVLRLRYGFDGEDEHTLEQIGAKLTLTRERIRQIEVKAKEELIFQLAMLGVQSRTAPGNEEPPPPPAPRPKAWRPAPRPEAKIPAQLARPSRPLAPPARPLAAPERPPTPRTQAAPPRMRPPAPPVPPLRPPVRPAPSARQPLADRPEQADFRIERLGKDLAAGTKEHLPGSDVVPAPGLEAWLPELVDQGLSSRATRITIQRSQAGSLSWLAFIHDGEPSARAVLRERLLRGFADDRVIAGLWPAFRSALGLFRELVVWRLGTVGDPQRSMVLASPRPDGAWSLFEGTGAPPPEVHEAAAAGPCSVVVFRRPRLDYGVADLRSVLRTLRADLGLTLGNLLLPGRVTLTVDGQRVTPRDPFLSRNPAAQDLGTEQVTAGGHSALVNPHVLPHPASLASGDAEAAGNPADWERMQGFYVRCEQRYLSCAGWLGLPGLEETAATSLARVAVEIQPDERNAWGLREPGQAVLPPEPLRPRLAALATLARRRSEQVLAR